MKIGDSVFVHGYVDEIRKDCVIIRNRGGYFGTERCEVIQGDIVRCKDCKDSRVYGKTTQWLACESVMEGQATDPDGYCYLGKRREESEVEE